MAASQYLEQTLFKEQNPAADQLFEERSESLFEPGDGKSFVDIHVERPWQKGRSKEVDIQDERRNFYEETSEVKLLSEHKREPHFSEPPSPVDKCSYLSQEPPRYNEAPGFQPERVCGWQELTKIASESNNHNRFCLIRQRHSYSRLQIDRKLFEVLLSRFGVFPKFKEFALLFGWKHEETEIGHPQLRFRRITSRATDRSNRVVTGYECAYALRYIELNHRSTKNPWSLRQTAVYQRYNSKSESSTWVIISASEKMEICLDRYLKSKHAFGTQNPFEIHLLLLETALANWRPFIISLTQKINEQSDKVLVASINEKEALHSGDVGTRQMLKDLEDELLNVILVFESIYDTLTKLLRHYEWYRHAGADSIKNPDERFDCLSEALLENQEDVMLHQKKIQTLHEKLKGAINLLSNILDLGNGFSLKQLAEEARNENVTMRRLAEKSTEDSAAVKVLTIITLIYLPATVVSNFFSSQFVSTEEQNSISSIKLTSNAWLFAAISVPLTLATIGVWWAWILLQAYVAKHKNTIDISPLKTLWTPEPQTRTCENKEQ